MHLAAEVERLAAELETSRARIAELETRIDVDPLTEALNRRGFERELKRSLAYVKRYGATAAVIYLDLDEFKPINDRHGHAAGDAMLKAIAAPLARNVRASDVVARIGGDEFVVLFWNVTAADAAAKAAALEAAVGATTLRWGDATLAAGASAGMTLVGPPDSAAEVLSTRRCRHVCAQDGAAGRCFPGTPGRRCASGDDIRREFVFDEGDAVAQVEFALLQALDLDDVGPRRRLKRRNRRVEVAMLLLKACKLRSELAFFLLCHRRLGRTAARSGQSIGAPLHHRQGRLLTVSYYRLSRFRRRPTSPTTSFAQRGFSPRGKWSIFAVRGNDVACAGAEALDATR